MSFLTTPDGSRLRVCDCGTGERTIVLVHGWKGSHRTWDPTIYRLAPNFRVIAFDNRGMGESDKPSGRYDFGVLAADLAFVLEALDAHDVTLVGWSMGCSISLEYVAHGYNRAARLVLVNGPIKLTQTPDFPWTMTEATLEALLDELAAGWPESERAHVSGAIADPARHSAYVEFCYGISLQTPLETGMRIVREQMKLDHRSLLPTIQIPVLALYGRHEPYYPAGLPSYIAEMVPDGRYEIFEQSAHAPPYEEPDRFAELIARFSIDDL